jgi:hypothetical protein
VSLYPLPDWPLDDYDSDLEGDDDDNGCDNCEHFAGGHYENSEGAGCRICLDVGQSCPGYEPSG